MSPLSRKITNSSPLLRTVAIAALMGTTMLVSPLTGARAESATSLPVQLAQGGQKSPDAKAATEAKGETVEARITKLHADLKITPDEQSKWDSVAQTMRDNATAMDKLVATKRTQDPKTLTAVDDLNNYKEFGEAHLAGLKDLTSSFKALYDSMPDAQKRNADHVFQSFGHDAAPARG
jgi:periplasmic protein CpxP/Spy